MSLYCISEALNPACAEVTNMWQNMTGRFSEVAGWNFIKLEVNVVELSLQNLFVLNYLKVTSFLHKGRRQTDSFRKGVKMGCFAP